VCISSGVHAADPESQFGAAAAVITTAWFVFLAVLFNIATGNSADIDETEDGFPALPGCSEEPWNLRGTWFRAPSTNIHCAEASKTRSEQVERSSATLRYLLFALFARFACIVPWLFARLLES
jgi:hypothetical protein